LSEYDDFQHDEANYAIIGLNTKKMFRMGDKIKIRVVAANLTKRQLDYEWVVEGDLSVKKAKSKRK
jgi:ribonuclease R